MVFEELFLDSRKLLQNVRKRPKTWKNVEKVVKTYENDVQNVRKRMKTLKNENSKRAKTYENVKKCSKTSTRFGTFFVVFEGFCAFSFVFERFCAFFDVLGRGFGSFVIYILVTLENMSYVLFTN